MRKILCSNPNREDLFNMSQSQLEEHGIEYHDSRKTIGRVLYKETEYSIQLTEEEPKKVITVSRPGVSSFSDYIFPPIMNKPLDYKDINDLVYCFYANETETSSCFVYYDNRKSCLKITAKDDCYAINLV